MSKKKSLGSSPIGYSSVGVEAFDFIPSIPVSSDTETNYHQSSQESKHRHFSGQEQRQEEVGSDKQIVSYSLEKQLIKRLKKMADDHKTYYSTITSQAISFWLAKHDY